MPIELLKDIESREIVPGFHCKFVHTDSITIGYFDIEKDSVLPTHSHVHEQVSRVIEGEFELTIAGEVFVMKPGKVAVIPSNVEHSGRAITACKIVDVFCPTREDYL